MRVLFLSPRQCWPTVSGAKLREYHFLRALAQRAELDYVFFREPGAPDPSPHLSWCRGVFPVDKPGMYTPGKVLRGLLSRQPLPIVNYSSPKVNGVLRELVAQHSYDLSVFDSIHMMGCEPLLSPGTRVIYNWHNIESELMSRYAGNTPSFARGTYARITAGRLAQAESAILKSAFGHLVCSEREQAQIRARAPGARVAAIENGVDSDYFRECPSAPHVEERKRLLFVGSMGYHANIEAADSFARKEWTQIRERFPQWTLSIVGSNPSPAVLALAELPGVEVTGTVPDVRPYYREAAVAIVPIRTGGGTRLKILEAMAAGVPVVSTEIGAEGLAVTAGKDILFASDGKWLEPITRAASHDSVRSELIRHAHHLIDHRYDWQILGNQLCDTCDQWRSEASDSSEATRPASN